MREGLVPTEPRSPDPAGHTATAPPPPPRPWWRSWRWPGAGLVVVVLAAAAFVAVDRRSTDEPMTSAADVDAIVDKRVKKAIADLQALPPAGVAVYDAIGPPLVVVQTETSTPAADSTSLGSGVVVNAEGDILTSLHVVQGAGTITVSFSDGSRSRATIESSDPSKDIAVLRPATLPQVVVPAVLGGGARIGDEAFAVGHPLGFVGSLSAGVISGLDRTFRLANGTTLQGMIQFDAAVNPGNSGGPLLDRKGHVIGIVTGLINPSGDGDFIGIGFAVPISAAGGAAGAPAR